MKLSRESSWGDGDIAPRLLGCYEAELHGTVRQLASRSYSRIINIGYAEGYYAVGLAQALPGARVIGFDAMPEAQRICRIAAHMNGVSERVQLHGVCDPPTLNGFIERGCFLLVDCEGAEKELLRPDLVPRLASVDLLVECHDFIDASITKTLQDRFRSTHHIDLISEASRNPALYPVLDSFSSLDRWLSVCEFRPTAMHWMLLTSRSH